MVRETLEKINQTADAMCISQTPVDALEREWEEHDIRDSVSIIAGQERGTKVQHIEMAAKGKYPSEKILMIGDSGDRKAAKANGALFYPINPDRKKPAGSGSSMKPSTGSFPANTQAITRKNSRTPSKPAFQNRRLGIKQNAQSAH